MKKFLLAFSLLLAAATQAEVLPLRAQATVVNELLAERFDTVLPAAMAQTGIDMWVVVSREYNEDPVLKTMLPAEWLNARRRTILVFYRDGASGKVERLAVARYNVGNSIKAAWDMKKFPNQWDALVDIIKTRNPNRIGLNTSAHFGHADGIDHTEYSELLAALPAAFKPRVVSAEPLAVRWLETRTEREMQIYPQLISATHKIIEEGFSERVITPGITTSEDVVWWFRQKIRDLGYDTWFHPSVEIQRQDTQRANPDVITPGDLLHVDIGITYLRLNTDIQQHAYVLKPGETAAPAALAQAFVRANRVQDILLSHFKEGRSGNAVLAASLQQARAEGLQPTIYTHPIGYHGHAAGPAIGMWDAQGGVPGSGDDMLRPRTAYSIELNAASDLPGWREPVRMMLEEDAYFDASGVRYINGRQRQLLLLPRPSLSVE
ncbi:M24 family metallopeptidase [Pseudoduganella sp. FT25W]|uniref:M24 family metallopeptidase n=1 Tax=Duganella alba TaxID=2666081 RepID=A0A6L5QMK1_9BURK|nr:M24 family metallopeptidase [Duganella alba]MRX10482.1 M24 family metallopeptidase [Duganella alba]MRX18102.1 M24 family metallopeptidase [Duganella alba]